MNDALQNLITRFSTKNYQSTPVSDALLDQVLNAGLYAATGRNVQHSVMVAIRDPETLAQLSHMNAHYLGVDSDPFYGAPCVIVVLSDPERNTCVEDGALVMGNLMNAANALGLGSCWVHRAREMFASDEGKALLKKWGVPQHLVGIGNCLLGYPKGDIVRKPREPGRIYKVD